MDSNIVFGLTLIVFIIPNLIMAFLCDRIAKRKNYNASGFFLLGFITGIIGLIIVLVIPDSNNSNKTNSNTKTQTYYSPADELLKYKKLLDEGVITKEEFEKKKSQLI